MKRTFRFRKPELADYMDELLEGRLLLVINPVNSKSSSFDSLSDTITYTLTFNVTHPRVDLSAGSGYRRYDCDCDRFTYRQAGEGDEFYLILWPGGNVRACFPRNSTNFPPELAPVLKRDYGHTGVPRSIDAECQDMQQWLQARQRENKSPEQLRHLDALRGAYHRFEKLKTKAILLCIPASILIFLAGLLSVVAGYTIFGCVLIMLTAFTIPLVMLFLKIFEKKLCNRFCQEIESQMEQK